MVQGNRVLLISPNRQFHMDNELYPSGALVLLGTLLQDRGHIVKVVHMVADNIVDIQPTIDEFKPDIIGLTVGTYQSKTTKALTKSIKQKNNCPIVIGGPHPSALKQNILSEFVDVDIAVLGEAEKSFIDIVEGKPLNEIKGICYRNGQEIITNTASPLWENLDSLPFPKVGMDNLSKYSGPYPLGRKPSVAIMASRGCPFNCSFCAKSVCGKKVRYHSPEYVVALMQYLHKDYNIKEISIHDDTFNMNRVWTEDILRRLIETGLNKKIIFRVMFRVNEGMVDLDLLQLIKEAGCWMIFYGVESGNQDMLDHMKKGITVEEVKRAFQLTHRVGLKTTAAFIIGLTGESEETIKDSINLWKDIKPYRSGFSKAIPFPDTEFEMEARQLGNLLYSNYDDYVPNKMLVKTEYMSAQELDKWAEKCANMLLIDTSKTLMKHPIELYKSVNDIGLKGIKERVVRLMK